MARKLRYDREAVLDGAFALVRREGLEALNARALAHELGCSTQPIFRAFSSMDELRDAVVDCAMACYTSQIEHSASLDPRPYKGTGLAYIRFATEEPQLFRMLFMCDRRTETNHADKQDTSMTYVLDTIQAATGYDRETAQLFHHLIWIFTHGLAVMVATQYVPFTDEQMSQLLSEHYLSTKARFDARLVQREKATVDHRTAAE